MKFYITYFYNIRFLKPNQVPFSTAIWDPKWYHDFKGQDYVFQDKNNVWNGFRIEPLHPSITEHWSEECIGCDHSKQGKCGFTEGYKNQLNKLNFPLIMNYFIQTINHLSVKIENPEVVILVHEKPDNPCSERWALIDFFKSHGIDIEELKIE